MEICFDELRQFDRTGQFIGKHPFIAQKSERERVADLLRSDPDRYFEERKNIELNITRYTSQIGSTRFSEDKKKEVPGTIGTASSLPCHVQGDFQ